MHFKYLTVIALTKRRLVLHCVEQEAGLTSEGFPQCDRLDFDSLLLPH